MGCGENDVASSQPSVDRSSQADEATASHAVESAHPLVRDVTEQTGIDFRHRAGGAPYFVPRSIGSGLALLDFNNDGRLDVYLIQNAGPQSSVRNQLYQQQPDGTFENVSDQSGLDIDGYGMGAAVGDVNNDGLVDVFVTEYGRVRLFVNESDEAQARFVDATQQAGLDNTSWGTSASFVDYDRDGWLDLVVVNYLDYDPSRQCSDAGGRPDFCGPQSFAPVAARLFRNRGLTNETGEGGTKLPQFEDVTVSAGLASRPGKGLGVLCTDLNGDDWPDIFMANDGVANTLWINQTDGTFVEEGAQRGVAYNAVGEAEADMGIAYGDVTGDHALDLFVTHRASESHTLWVQHAAGIFIDQTPISGVTKTAWRGTGFGTAFGDLDNDGDLDLVWVNGRVLRHSAPAANPQPGLDEFWWPYAQADQILMNDGHGKFHDCSMSNSDFSGTASVSRGLACGDLNNDGKLDLIVTSIDGPVRVFQNDSKSGGHWLMVRALDPSLRRDAYGAKLVLSTGDQTLVREINPAYSYLSSNDVRAHFGLGEVERYESLTVTWPNGDTESFGGGPVDRMIEVIRGTGN